MIFLRKWSAKNYGQTSVSAGSRARLISVVPGDNEQ